MNTNSRMLLVALVLLLGIGFYFNSHRFIVRPSPVPSVAPSASIPSPSTKQTISSLPTKYITAVDWPPQIQDLNQPFACTEAGSETERAGQTKIVLINNRTYCVTKITEGAAGSVYTQYAYAFGKNSQTEIRTFSLKSTQCGNYPEPEKTECETERQTFNIDNFIDQYIQNFK